MEVVDFRQSIISGHPSITPSVDMRFSSIIILRPSLINLFIDLGEDHVLVVQSPLHMLELEEEWWRAEDFLSWVDHSSFWNTSLPIVLVLANHYQKLQSEAHVTHAHSQG